MLYIVTRDKNIFLYLFTVFSYFLCEGCGIQLAFFSITDHDAAWKKPKVTVSFLFGVTAVLSPSSSPPVQ